MLRFLSYLLLGVVAVLVIAYFLLANPSYSREELAAKYANSESEFLTLGNGGTAHYRDEGNPTGLPLVLVHGSNASLHTWEPWVAELSDTFRIISVDLPAHGLTGAVPNGTYSISHMAQFLDEVLTKIGVDRFALAGNSMGGNVVWNYALDYPSKVSHLILVDASGVPDPVETTDPYVFRLLATPIVNRLLINMTPRSFFEDGLKSAFTHDEFVTAEMVDRYYELNLMEGTPQATLIRFSQERDFARASELKNIAAPTLVMWGKDDELVPVESAKVFDREIPNSTSVIYENVGHIPMEEVAQQSAEDVRAFILSIN